MQSRSETPKPGNTLRDAFSAHRLRFAFRRRKAMVRRLLGLDPSLGDEELVASMPRIVEYENNSFDLRHPRCTAQIGAAIIRGTYEDREIDLIRRYVDPSDRVLELGACMGATSLVIYDLVGRDNHLVVEADERNLQLAKDMFALNEKDVRIIYGFLVSGDERPTTVEFSSNSNPSSSSVVTRDGVEQVASVPTRSFEDLLAEEQSTVLVLDIEGGEYDLFTKAKNFGGLRCIMMEAHPWVIGEDAMAEMLESLAGHGFRISRSFMNGRFLLLVR